jgi:hypothetical protein
MHVEVEDRKRQSAVAPPDVRVRYVIVDRPLDEKRRDGGWRLEKGLVDKYDRLFVDQVAAAMTGDGSANVEIVDLRGRLTSLSSSSAATEGHPPPGRDRAEGEEIEARPHEQKRV